MGWQAVHGMTLEPEMPAPEEDENPELAEFKRRLWWALPFTVVVVAPAMARHGLAFFDGLFGRPQPRSTGPGRPRTACHPLPGQRSSCRWGRWVALGVFEEAVWRCRLGFFRDLQEIADRNIQEAMASDISLPLAGIRRHIDSGAAHAALCAHFDAKDRQLVEGSPTFLLNEGRQKLYGSRLPDH